MLVFYPPYPIFKSTPTPQKFFLFFPPLLACSPHNHSKIQIEPWLDALYFFVNNDSRGALIYWEKMQTFPAIRSSNLSPLPGANLFKPRTQVTFPRKLFFGCARFANSGNTQLPDLGGGPANLLVEEKEEAKAVLTLFLKKKGLSKAVAARTVSKSALFIDHLVLRLHSDHKDRYLVGRELTTLEIRDALNSYLETLYEEFGDILVDVVENFPNPPIEESLIENLSIPPVGEGSVVPDSARITTLESKKLKSKKLKASVAVARLTENSSTGKPPPHIIYLTELGMDIEVIKEVTWKFPTFAFYSLDEKVKPMVEFLLDLGIPKSDIPVILRKRPQLLGLSLSENLIPTMKYLENLGMDKKQWMKAIRRFPSLLTYSRQKLESTINLLYELGLPAENLGKVLTRAPKLIGHSLVHIKTTAQYFHSLGADVGSLLHKYPQIFCLSIEGHLKPITEFLLEIGFSNADIGSMISTYGALYTLSLSDNIRPKWEFFLTMCYPKSDLVRFPLYFGCSLDVRIKPRYATMLASGVTMSLNTLLSLPDDGFERILKRKMEKNG